MSRPVTSASNLFRRKLCPGSEKLEYGLPETDSEQSKEGVLLHDYAAHPEYDRTVLRPDQRDVLAKRAVLLNSCCGARAYTGTVRVFVNAGQMRVALQYRH